MKKLLMAAAVFAATSANVSAQGISFGLDVDGAGVSYGKKINNLLQLTQAGAPNYIYQDLGADNVFTNGDRFSEYGRYILTYGAMESAGGSLSSFNFDPALAGLYADIQLGGYITNVVGNIYDIRFDTGNMTFFDSTANELFELAVTGGGISQFNALNGVPTGSYGLNFTFSNVTAAGVFYLCNPAYTTNLAQCTIDISTINLALLLDAETVNGSVNANVGIDDLQGTNIVGVENGWVNPYSNLTQQKLFRVTDNGGTLRMYVPEPEMLALLGIGLLGMTVVGKKRTS
jgi:hypothetical protein